MDRKLFKVPKRLFLLLVLVTAIAITAYKAQAIMDFFKLYGYQPSAEVVRLADNSYMSPLGRKLFYVNHPVLADRASFSQYCSSRGEQTIVLGCYHGVDRGIYLFDVDDERLQGIEEVTAAHEMLHAAYDRLSMPDQQRIDRQLEEFFNTSVSDERLMSTIAAYRKSEPNDVVNEMHSIFATEVSSLPAELEAYYQQYFTDRKQVVALASSYQQEFTARQDKVKAYDRQLQVLKSTMETNTRALERQEASIEALRETMEADRQAGNIDAYNQAVPVFNQAVDAYNSLISATQEQIETYNQLVASRNDLASEVKQLAQSIDSTLSPISQ